MELQLVESHACFGGRQEVWEHESKATQCVMRFGIYLPPQVQDGKCPVLYWLSGLTCTEQNFISKAGAQRYAAEHGIILVAPDTSPRGEDVPDAEGWDIGLGAGFYVNATQEPFATHYHMFDYVAHELPALIEENFYASDVRSIAGHSMGGHGALIVAFKNPGRYRSVSAFSPIVAPTQVPWGQKAFGTYLGDSDSQVWKQWDACALLAEQVDEYLPMRVDVGDEDQFLSEQLRPGLLEQLCAEKGYPLELHMQPGYDHSYYFVSSFIGEHIAFHAGCLK